MILIWKRSRLGAAVLSVVGLLALGVAPPAEAQSFQGLGDFAGGIYESYAFAVSPDGPVVVGYGVPASGVEAFRWTAGGGMVGLGDLVGGNFFSSASGVSADGSVVVGISDSAVGHLAFRWTSGGGMVGLGDLPGGSISSSGRGVSSDGSVVIGDGISASGPEAFRWTSGGGMVGLGDLAGGVFSSIAHAVSADGSVVVGSSNSASGNEAFRWTSGGGMVGLGDLAGGGFSSKAYAVSADGSVVVGSGRSDLSQREAFRWTSGGGMVGLGGLTGGSFRSRARGVSADGSVVVGGGTTGSGNEAFIWDENNGMRNLRTVLTDLGVDMTGWTLSEAWGVSADGMKIVGSGRNPSGHTEAWLAVLEPTQTVDLAVTKSGSPDPVHAGNSLTYTVTVTNNGPSSSTGSTVADVLPAGLTFLSSADGCTEVAGTVTCSIGALAVAANQSVSFVVAVDLAHPGGVITNTATVAGNEADPVAGNNSDSVDVVIIGLASAIPTLGQTGLALLVILLASAGLLLLRRGAR